MLDKIKTILEFWLSANPAKKLSTLYLFIILGLTYLLYYNDKMHKINEGNYRKLIEQQNTDIISINRRCDSINSHYQQKFDEQKEKFTDREIKTYDYFTNLFKDLFHKVETYEINKKTD